MGTKIYSSNIIIGSDSDQFIIENTAVKRLPIHVLMSDDYFIKWLKQKVSGASKSDSNWNKLPKNKITELPNVKIFYMKYLGDVATEPELTF
jgi:hypothetical protein